MAPSTSATRRVTPRRTSALLVEAFGDIGLERLAGRHPAWISIARNFLVEIGPPPVRPDRAVLQIDAYPARDDLLALLQQLSRSGYTLALGDYDGRDDIQELMSLCSIVKVDVERSQRGGADRACSRRRACRARCWSPPASATRPRFAGLPASRLHLLPGRVLRQAAPVPPPRRGDRRPRLPAPLGELTAGDVSFEDLERIIASDVGLALKLLRYVNSAFFALPRTVGSVREALSLLGVRTVRRWATVMAISAIPDVPDELVALGLRRARMCEMLAGSALPEERETLFTIGLFSVADALLDAPMAEVLDSLPFTDEIQDALMRREGPKGELLAAVIAYERGEFPTLEASRGRRVAGRRLPRRARVGRRGRPRAHLSTRLIASRPPLRQRFGPAHARPFVPRFIAFACR